MGILFILIAAIFWGIIGLFTRPLLDMGFTPIQLSAARALVGAVCAVVYCLVKNPKLLKIRFTDLWIFIGTGLVSFTFMNIFYYMTQKLCSLSTAAVLLYTSPIFVMIMSALFFKEKITYPKVFALILAAAGCVLVSGIGASDFTLTGFLTGIGSGLAYALYSIFSRMGLKRYHSVTITAYTFIVAVVVTIPICRPVNASALIARNPGSLLLMLGLGTITAFVPFLCYTKGMEIVDTSKAAIIVTLEPVVASLLGIFVFKETLSLTGITGILLVLGAVFTLNIEGRFPCQKKRRS